MRDFIRLLLASSISLIILASIIALLIGMEQGLTIIVSLFYEPFWLCVTVLMIGFLALILSHFPYYFDLAIKDRDNEIRWSYARRFLFLRYYYHDAYEREGVSQSSIEDQNSVQTSSSIAKDSWLISFARRHIGVLCYNIFFAVMIYVNASIFKIANNDSCTAFGNMDIAYVFIAALILLIVHLLMFIYFKNVNGRLDNLTNNKDDIDELKDSIRLNLHLFNFLLLINAMCIFTLLYLSYVGAWDKTNLYMLMGLCLFNAFLYIYFRLIRPWFIYYRKDDHCIDGKNDYPPKQIKGFYIKSYFSFLSGLSSTPNYLASMGAFGMIVVFGILLPGLFSDKWIYDVHPVPLLLAIIIFYYSAVVIVLKHLIYLQSKAKHSDAYIRFIHKRQLYVLYVLILSLGIFLFINADADNDLHELPLVEKKNPSNLDDFLGGIKESDHYYILGSYGGGLKANSWNMMLLKEFHDSIPGVIDKTLCFSGVSGGALGIANHLAIQNHYHKNRKEKMDSVIFDIANSNMLSNDLYGFLIKDFWREFIPCEKIFFGKDRSHISMNLYSQKIDCKNWELSLAMSDYWQEFKDQNYYPAIIFNTTPTSGNYGVACSIDSIRFYNSIDILDHSYLEGQDLSLSFFGAASTANRFPFFSPAARVPNKGHFVDGGYFENSGLVNAVAFYDNIKYDLPGKGHKLKVINIVNDKNLYMLDLLKENAIDIQNNEENHEAEISSILKAIVSLERMPRYVRSKLRADSVKILSLHMPYIFNMDDLKALFKVSHFSEAVNSRLRDLIKENRDVIIEALDRYNENGREYDLQKWGVVTPPLGRILSEPAVVYQRAMIKSHPFLNAKMDSLQ